MRVKASDSFCAAHYPTTKKKTADPRGHRLTGNSNMRAITMSKSEYAFMTREIVAVEGMGYNSPHPERRLF